jgi:hypothetical protein
MVVPDCNGVFTNFDHYLYVKRLYFIFLSFDLLPRSTQYHLISCMHSGLNLCTVPTCGSFEVDREKTFFNSKLLRFSPFLSQRLTNAQSLRCLQCPLSLFFLSSQLQIEPPVRGHVLVTERRTNFLKIPIEQSQEEGGRHQIAKSQSVREQNSIQIIS